MNNIDLNEMKEKAATYGTVLTELLIALDIINKVARDKSMITNERQILIKKIQKDLNKLHGDIYDEYGVF